MEDTREKKKIKAETGFIVAVLLIIVAVIEGTTYRKIIPANQPKVVVILPGDMIKVGIREITKGFLQIRTKIRKLIWSIRAMSRRKTLRQ